MNPLFAPLFSHTPRLAIFGRRLRPASENEQGPIVLRADNVWYRKPGLASCRIILACLTGLGVLSLAFSRGAIFGQRAQSSSSDSEPARLQQDERSKDRLRQQLQTDFAEPAFAADLATLKTYQKALLDKLASTDEALAKRPVDVTLLKRRQLLKAVLSNAGGTGVSDRLAAIETVQRMAAEPEVWTRQMVVAAHQTMKSLRDSTASWKTGPFSSAARFLGLLWQEERGLTTGTPYVWGERGWEPDASSQRH